jgi:anaerobic selenocysteine-containing dehydrogenase
MKPSEWELYCSPIKPQNTVKSLTVVSYWREKMLVEKASVCTLDCPDTCSLTVTVDEASQRIVKIRGSHANPLTHGTICTKVTF